LGNELYFLKYFKTFNQHQSFSKEDVWHYCSCYLGYRQLIRLPRKKKFHFLNHVVLLR